jgi:hypothetical protein
MSANNTGRQKETQFPVDELNFLCETLPLCTFGALGKHFRHNVKFFIIFSMLTFCDISRAFSQEVTTKEEEVTVVAPYQPKVSDATKISLSPKIPDERLIKPEFTYNIKSKTFKAPIVLEPIKPAKIAGESVTELYKNYIRAGIGNYWTPYIEFNANKLRSKKNAFGVHANYLASFGGIKDYAFPGNSVFELDGYGKKFFNKHTLTGEAAYKRTGVHFYGFKPDDFPELDLEKNDYKQGYNLIELKTGLESNYTDDDAFNHAINFRYFYLFDKFKAREHNLMFDAGLNKNTTFFDFSEREKLGIDAGVDYYFDQDSINNVNQGIIRFDPYYNMGFEQYYFKVGLKMELESGSTSYFHVYPIVRAEVQVVKDILITYAGIFGEMMPNSLLSMSDENPFINSTLEKRFSNNKFSQYGGLKGHITKYLDYNLSFVNSTIENMPFYVNDTVSAIAPGLNNQFTVIYDKVKYSRVIVDFGFHYKNKLNAMLQGKYNNYFMDTEDYAWHKPKLEVSLSANYNIQDKFLIRAELISGSKIYGQTFEKTTSGNVTTTTMVPVEIKGYADINLGVEYRYTKLLSGFINLNNILGQRYYKWYNYPSQKFNLMIGVTYSF